MNATSDPSVQEATVPNADVRSADSLTAVIGLVQCRLHGPTVLALFHEAQQTPIEAETRTQDIQDRIVAVGVAIKKSSTIITCRSVWVLLNTVFQPIVSLGRFAMAHFNQC